MKVCLMEIERKINELIDENKIKEKTQDASEIVSLASDIFI